MIRIRSLQPEDCLLLLDLFRATIRQVNVRDYSPEQIQVWASADIDEAEWAARFAGRFVAVAELGGRIAGFAELEANGHIDRFYVSADHQRLGVGRALLGAVVEEADRLGVSRLVVEASITARPFFESQGFMVLAPQEVPCRGVSFRNYRMERECKRGTF